MIAQPANHGTPMVEMDVDDYLQPVEKAVRSTFLTIATRRSSPASDRGGIMTAATVNVSAGPLVD